jgi:hypothetical protein
LFEFAKKHSLIIFFVGWLPFSLFAQLKAPITVHNVTSASATNFPVALGIPLPKGKYQSTSSFAVTNKDGVAIPAQFEALNRHWASDNSLRHILVLFMSDVPANTSVQYHLREGSGAGGNGVQIAESGNEIIVNTGVLRAQFKKSGFNLFDQVYFDQNSDGNFSDTEKVLSSDKDNGGVLTFWNNDLQKSSDTTPAPVFEIEERGPVRVVIRFETHTRSRSATEHRHGYQARLYFFAGSPLVRVRYTIKNSDHTTADRRPLYFDDFSLVSKLNFTPTKVRFGYDNGVYETAPSSGHHLYQSRHDQFVLRDGNGNELLTGTKGSGWIDLSDPSHGVTAMVRDFWQAWPNAVELTGQNQIRIGLWPRFGYDWWWEEYGGNKFFTTTGFYWLDDMQEPTKEVWYFFHNGNVSTSSIKGLSDLIKMPPVGSVPITWYRDTRVTLDLGGYVPLDAPQAANGSFHQYLLGEYSTERSENWDSGTYMYGWFNYAGNIDRRYACTGGGWPYSGAHFLMTGNPVFYHVLRAKAVGELNGRPMWLSGYEHDRDQAAANLFFGYCWTNWRFSDATGYRDGSDKHNWWPRDLAHLWIYDLEEYYYISGDERIYDWYRFIGEAMKVPLVDQYGNNGALADAQTRSLAHALAAVLQAYRVTGNKQFLETAQNTIEYIRQRQIPYNGTLSVTDENGGQQATLEMGFLARTLINFLIEIADADPQAYVDAWGILQGILEWNLNLSNFSHFWSSGKGSPAGTAVQIIDAQAWFYLHTGRKEFKDHLLWYFNNGAYGTPRNWGWIGDNVDNTQEPFISRITHYMLKYPKMDSIPPTKIVDLTAASVANGVRLTWTAPSNAKKYHIRWSERPISATFTTDKTLCNFWAARGIGNRIMARPGNQEEITVLGLPEQKELFFAAVSFDSANNMSEVSNVIRIFYKGPTTNVRVNEGVPKEFLLQQNFPNPFTHGTHITYQVSEPAWVHLRIYNIHGQLVRSFRRWHAQPSKESITWDGLDNSGLAVGSGVYYYLLTINGNLRDHRKMLLLR